MPPRQQLAPPRGRQLGRVLRGGQVRGGGALLQISILSILSTQVHTRGVRQHHQHEAVDNRHSRQQHVMQMYCDVIVFDGQVHTIKDTVDVQFSCLIG